MKLKIWSKKESEKSDSKQLFLKLEKSKIDDDIILVVVDKNGDKLKSANLMVFDNDHRRFVILSGVNKDLPICLDHLTRSVYVNKDYEISAFVAHSESRNVFSIDSSLKSFSEFLEKMKEKEEE